MNVQNDEQAAADRFGSIAERFCSLVDSAGTLNRKELLAQVYRILPDLIGEATRLPDIEFGDDEDDDQETAPHQSRILVQMKHEEWARLYRSLGEMFGDWNSYWQVFDPTKDTKAIQGSLADDIAGVYQDLKDGFLLGKTGKFPTREITFHWRNQFYIHWGRHAIKAFYTIHTLLQDTFTGLDQGD